MRKLALSSHLCFGLSLPTCPPGLFRVGEVDYVRHTGSVRQGGLRPVVGLRRRRHPTAQAVDQRGAPPSCDFNRLLDAMDRIITSQILVAYSQCPRKAFLLLCTNEQGTMHEYTRILEQQRCANRSRYITGLKQKSSDVQPYSPDNLNNGSGFLINATFGADGLEADCDVLTKVKSSSSLGRYSYQPTITLGTYSISKKVRFAHRLRDSTHH